jgi:hypothetical protein
MTYGDDQFDVELLHEKDPATRRDIRVEVYKLHHVKTKKAPRFILLLYLFFYVIVFYFRSVSFSLVTFDVFALSCFISRVF